jgi:hypothetical protein
LSGPFAVPGSRSTIDLSSTYGLNVAGPL